MGFYVNRRDEASQAHVRTPSNLGFAAAHAASGLFMASGVAHQVVFADCLAQRLCGLGLDLDVVFWSGKVVGDLYVTEIRDAELGRHVRCATVKDGAKELMLTLLDVVLVAAKPDWWVMTGWERKAEAVGQPGCAYQQSWVLIPVDMTG